MTRTLLHDALLSGRRAFCAGFSKASARPFKAGELLADLGAAAGALHRIRTGWACQFRDLSDARRAILDIYLPGDVLGLDAVLHTRPMEKILTLTSGIIETAGEDGLSTLVRQRETALYAAWLLSQRQRRSDRLISTLTSLDARGRVAMMILDFYKRLHAQRVIASTIFYFPLTQNQIGSYLGLTVVHVNRVLRSLRDDGIVSVEKHSVTILELEQLERLAEGKEVVKPRPGVAVALEATTLPAA